LKILSSSSAIMSNRAADLCSMTMKLTRGRYIIVLSWETLQTTLIKVSPRNFIIQERYYQFLSEINLGSNVTGGSLSLSLYKPDWFQLQMIIGNLVAKSFWDLSSLQVVVNNFMLSFLLIWIWNMKEINNL
jgi:hypothetical protein